MDSVLAGVASLGYGFASAFIPVLNAEAYVGVYAVAAPVVAVLVVLAISVGQTIGKVVIFEAARGGKRRLSTREREPRQGSVAARIRRWNERLIRLLESPRGGAATVLISASVGLPPLAAVSVVAGASAHRRITFIVCCLVGRLARFAVVAAPVVYVSR